jgi:hypothetical protein
MLRPHFTLRSFLMLLIASAVAPPLYASTSASKTKSSIHLTTAAQPSASGSLLPEMFSGWQMTGETLKSTNPQAADEGDAAALEEYGFTGYEAVSYARDHDTLTVKAMAFGDATGAFGAFTFYRRPNMRSEQIGQGAAFDGVRVLFWSGTTLVDARFAHITPMSAAELRDLATQLPQPKGNQGRPPTLPAYLPSQHLEPMTVQYAIGPQAYRLSGGVLPAGLVDFGRSAEVVTAQYNALNGTGTLTIINYPTPEIAIDREHAIRAFFASHGAMPGAAQGPPQNSWTSALSTSNPAALQSRRSGPLVAVTSGSFSAPAAQQLLQRVHYEVNLATSNSKPYVPDTTKVVQIILGVAVLVGIFALIAIIAGISLGGGRVLWRKMRNKPGSIESDTADFIRLNLKD